MKMRCALDRFFSRKEPPAQPKKVLVEAPKIKEPIAIPHKVQKIEFIDRENGTVTLQLTPGMNSDMLLSLCRSIEQDSRLLTDEDDSNEIKSFSIVEKANYCVLIRTAFPRNFLEVLVRSNAITIDEMQETIERIESIFLTIMPN